MQMAQTVYHEYVYCGGILVVVLYNTCPRYWINYQIIIANNFIGLNYEFESMENAESTNFPFTIFRTRFAKGKSRTK